LASQACQRRLSEQANSRTAQGTAAAGSQRRAMGTSNRSAAQLARNGTHRSAYVPSPNINVTHFSNQRNKGGAASAKERGPRRAAKPLPRTLSVRAASSCHIEGSRR